MPGRAGRGRPGGVIRSSTSAGGESRAPERERKAPRNLEDGSRGPRVVEKSFHDAEDGLQTPDGPRCLQDPRRPQRLPRAKRPPKSPRARGPQEARIVDLHWFFSMFLAFSPFPASDARRRPKGPPGPHQDGPRGLQDGPRGPQDGPRELQSRPRRPQEGPKSGPRGPQERPKRGQRGDLEPKNRLDGLDEKREYAKRQDFSSATPRPPERQNRNCWHPSSTIYYLLPAAPRSRIHIRGAGSAQVRKCKCASGRE